MCAETMGEEEETVHASSPIQKLYTSPSFGALNNFKTGDDILLLSDSGRIYRVPSHRMRLKTRYACLSAAARLSAAYEYPFSAIRLIERWIYKFRRRFVIQLDILCQSGKVCVTSGWD